MFGDFLIRQMMKKQLAALPADMQEKLIAAVEKNPAFFMELAKDIQEKVKGGMDQQVAVMAVVTERKDELARLLSEDANTASHG